MAITKRRYKRKKRKKTRKKRKKTRKKRGGSKNTEKHLKSIKVKIEEINETKNKVEKMNNKQFKEWRLDERGGEKKPCGTTRKKCISTLNNNLGIMALQRDALIKMGQEEERRRALEIIPASRHVSTNNANEFLRALLDYEPKGGDDLELVKGKMYRGVSLDEEGWWRGFPINDTTKTLKSFPSNYVEKVDIHGITYSNREEGETKKNKRVIDDILKGMEPTLLPPPPPPRSREKPPRKTRKRINSRPTSLPTPQPPPPTPTRPTSLPTPPPSTSQPETKDPEMNKVNEQKMSNQQYPKKYQKLRELISECTN